jgi:hypothetical protein
MTFLRVFQSEWLKRKRSFASMLIVCGSLFTPAIVTIVRLTHYRTLPKLYTSETFWPTMWSACWESMAVFFLPLCAILATSLIAQIEFKSHAWKQVHTLPVSAAAIFGAKLAVILLMLAEFLALFNVGMYLAGMIPVWLVPGLPHPNGAFFALPLLRENLIYFAAVLPIVAGQYAIALRSPNALPPIGVGFLAWVGALAVVSSPYAIWWPYCYTIVQYIKDKPKGAQLASFTQLPLFAGAAFVVLTSVSYVLFVTKSEKG